VSRPAVMAPLLFYSTPGATRNRFALMGLISSSFHTE